MDNSTIPDFFLNDIIKRALDEDLGGVGDITSRAVIPNGTKYKAKINSRSTGVISGMQIAQMAFLMIDRKLEINTLIKDGSRVSPKDTCMTIEGDAKSILMAERVALNFAGRLSAISTMTSNFVNETEGTKAKITCTRKTTPGLRLVEKEAVRHGGGSNHRYGLNDAIMIKDNHIAAALERARKFASHMSAIEIEVDTLNQLEMVLSCGGANVVLLDNMTNKDMTTAVEMVDGLMLVEASGNMTLDRISSVASTGVDFISVGGLTHSVTNFDLGLDF